MNRTSVQLKVATMELLKSGIKGPSTLSAALGVEVPDSWSQFGNQAFEYVLEEIKHGESPHWWTHFAIDSVKQILVGMCGFKGQPNYEGMVEIGYEVVPKWRSNGYGTQMAKLLVIEAFKEPRVQYVQAHTEAIINASTHILVNLGFEKCAAITIQDTMPIWRWRLSRTNYTNHFVK